MVRRRIIKIIEEEDDSKEEDGSAEEEEPFVRSEWRDFEHSEFSGHGIADGGFQSPGISKEPLESEQEEMDVAEESEDDFEEEEKIGDLVFAKEQKSPLTEFVLGLGALVFGFWYWDQNWAVASAALIIGFGLLALSVDLD